MPWRILLGCWLALPAMAMAQATVVVLDTLHQMHADVPAYDNAALGRAIKKLKPDALCVELQPGDLAARLPEQAKQEYPAVIYPLIDRHRYRVYAMQPAAPPIRPCVFHYLPGNRPAAAATACCVHTHHGAQP